MGACSSPVASSPGEPGRYRLAAAKELCQSVQRPARIVESPHRVAAIWRHERVVVRVPDSGDIPFDIARNQGLRRVGYPFNERG